MTLRWVLFLGFTLLAKALLRLKLQHWFPKYERHWIEAAASCQQELTNYLHYNRTHDCPTPCACAADCLLQNVAGTMQSNFASAQVLLGLVPAIFVLCGPTIAEVAALSTYRPLLAVLLALGSPAINVRRLFRHIEICEPIVRPLSRSSQLWPTWLARQNAFCRTSFQVLCHVIALAAIANNVRISVYIDLRTISGWRCGVILMPLVWSLLPVVVHAWGMVAVRVRLQDGYSWTIQPAIRSTVFQKVSTGEDNVLSEVLFWLSSLFAIVHMIFGILELSSLVFISTLEALEVFTVYAVSALFCQLVLLLELANMRYELSKKPDAGPPLSGITQISKVEPFRVYTN